MSNRMRQLLFAGVILLAAGFSGFIIKEVVRQYNLPAYGPISAKTYREAYTSTRYTYMCTHMAGEMHMGCPRIPHNTHHPARFSITLENGKHINLPESAWNKLAEGEIYGTKPKASRKGSQ